MALDFNSLQSLLQADKEAMNFYDSLPETAREQISKRAPHVNSYDDLKAMALNLSGPVDLSQSE